MATPVDLALQAALRSGRPSFTVFVASEAEADRALVCAQAVLGPLPQAELIAPWDEADAEEPWELRVDVLGAGAEHALLVDATLREAGFTPSWAVAPSAGRRAAEDGQLRAVEELVAGQVIARLWFDAEDGGVTLPDLVPGDAPDADLVELELELALALQTAAPGMVLQTSRGPDTVERVRDRRTGRQGVRLHFTPDPIDALPGEAVQAARHGVIAAIAQVSAAWSEHPRLALAPDLLWDTRQGLSVVAWTLQAPGVAVPSDGPVAGEPPPGWEAASALVDGLELQLCPRDPGGHEALCEALIAVASSCGAEARGSAPRWLLHEGVPVFSLCWWVPMTGASRELLDGARALDGVIAARLVPAAPAELAERWSCVDLGVWAGARAWVVRWQDGVTERDRVLPVRDASASQRDGALQATLAVALRSAGLAPPTEPGRPVLTEAGVRGLELRIDRVPRVEALLAALGRVASPGLLPLIPVALRGEGALVQLWLALADRDDLDQQP